ncbi:hypothetical protein BDZ89DRAFT_171221 [Hymenopellis radicata]|nr:hypothetical protein BDZ89DRAFT_171024 [Hymenopellis radicata]KAF9023371.1 hypothetical protein BDZ89DRAFT_171221 [Hymenopellis radicata]
MYASDRQLAENSSNYCRTYAHTPSLRIILAVDVDLDLTPFGFMASFEHVGYEFVLRLICRTIAVSNGATEAARAPLAADCSYNDFGLRLELFKFERGPILMRPVHGSIPVDGDWI